MVAQGSGDELQQGMRRVAREGDTVEVRDENGVVVVEIVTEWGKARQKVNLPAGFTVEHKPKMPLGGEE
jgi:formylmethanofuran dehydrogenase subunit D